MNFLTGQARSDGFEVAGVTLPWLAGQSPLAGQVKLGMRPEYVALVAPYTPGSLSMAVVQVQDVGTHVMLTASCAGQIVKARLSSDAAHFKIGATVWLQVLGEHSCIYQNEEIVA
jgi:glycerol transport system ATP-binding protein